MKVIASLAVLATLGLAAPVFAEDKACPAGEPRLEASLYFGLSIKGAPDLTDDQFADFLDKEVSSRFPDGLTVLNAQGRWRSDSGKLVREPSKLVEIVLPGGADDLAKLDAVREAYKRQFQQESVLEVLTRTCASF